MDGSVGEKKYTKKKSTCLPRNEVCPFLDVAERDHVFFSYWILLCINCLIIICSENRILYILLKLVSCVCVCVCLMIYMLDVCAFINLTMKCVL